MKNQYNTKLSNYEGLSSYSGLSDYQNGSSSTNIQSEKKLLIFAFYLPTGTSSEAKTRQRMAEIHGILKRSFNDVEEKTNYLIKFFIFPTKSEESKLECVFPKNVDDIDVNQLLSKLETEKDPKGFTIGEEDDEEGEDYLQGEDDNPYWQDIDDEVEELPF